MPEPTLNDYLDAAVERQRLSSDRALWRKLKTAQSIGADWRAGKAFPTEPQMIAVAQLAGENEEQALILLRIWRAKDEGARSVYRRLLWRFTSTGAAIAIAASVGGLADQPRSYSLDNYPKPDSFTQYTLCALRRLRDWISRRVAAARVGGLGRRGPVTPSALPA